MKRFVSIMFAVAVFVSGVISSFGQTPAKTTKPPAPPPAQSPATTVKPAVKSPARPATPAPPKSAVVAPKPAAPSPDTLASGSYIVYAQASQVLRVVFDPKKMRNLSVLGHFAVTDGEDGGAKELEVFVFDEDNYTKFSNEKAAAKPDPSKPEAAKPPETTAAKPADNTPPKAIYTSGKKTTGDFTVPIPNPGTYFVVFSNKAATAGKKTFTVDVHLQYDKIP